MKYVLPVAIITLILSVTGSMLLTIALMSSQELIENYCIEKVSN